MSDLASLCQYLSQPLLVLRLARNMLLETSLSLLDSITVWFI